MQLTADRLARVWRTASGARELETYPDGSPSPLHAYMATLDAGAGGRRWGCRGAKVTR
jgi:hypothetical protein